MTASSLRRVTYIIISVALLGSPAFSSPRIDFNSGWQFRTDPAKSGEQQGWFNQAPDGIRPVELPHTWNLGRDEDFIGTGWYFKRFSSSSSWKGQHVELHFGATFYKSRIWLNGKLLGEHEGGFSEYHVDLTPHLKESNYLAVEINNEPKPDTIPGADLKAGPDGTIYDWWPYGGIIRGAWLTVQEGAVLRWQHIDSEPVNGGAKISNHILLENLTERRRPLLVHVAVYAMDEAKPIASSQKRVMANPGTDPVNLDLALGSVKLWSFDNPFLYRSEVTVSDDRGHVLDTLDDNFGVRKIEIRDRHLYLNGERVRLTGMTRHEDSPWEGRAETRGTMLHDYDDLKNLQVTLTRPVHYQQDPFIYDYADRNGILMVPEIPMWQFSEAQMTNPKVISLAKQILHEMIDQNYNHPSIFAWSMENESATNTPGGNAYFRTMYAYSKELDPKRYVSFADDMIAFVDPAENASRLADFIMWNEYFGSWDAPESLLPAAIEKIGRGYPDKMVLITEFGYPGVFAVDSRTADKERVRIIRNRLKLYAKQDWIAGAIFWCYQDYHSFHNLRPGQPDSYVDHGVVDKNRQRRPSYFVWQEENEPAHIDIHWVYDKGGVPVGFQAVVSRRAEDEIPSYPLENYSVRWRVLDGKKAQVAGEEHTLDRIGPSSTVTGAWKTGGTGAYRLEFTLYRQTGFAAGTRVLTWRNPQEGGLTEEEGMATLPQ